MKKSNETNALSDEVLEQHVAEEKISAEEVNEIMAK